MNTEHAYFWHMRSSGIYTYAHGISYIAWPLLGQLFLFVSPLNIWSQWIDHVSVLSVKEEYAPGTDFRTHIFTILR